MDGVAFEQCLLYRCSNATNIQLPQINRENISIEF